MGIIVIDGSTVRAFVNDDVQFRRSVDERFVSLDTNNDGVLSRSEMRKAFEVMRLLESDSGADNNGSIGIEEFRSEVKKMMLVVAEGIGSSPMQMVVGDDDQNFLKKAADLEASKIC
ncbi:uncharacterized protein LOC112523680 [Cynara cardunculus var. scolymus]|nr:uncharacterized protein LOC112523680 [Cynara cardunculus var. scolymus]